jgi:hypothetical protein
LAPCASAARNDHASKSSGTVFGHLGLRDAGEKQTRVRLAVAIQELKKFIKLIVSLLEAFRSGSSRFSR